MAIIIVGGSAKGVGKTTLICGLIAALDEFRWTAVKITSDVHEGLPPIYQEQSAGPENDTSRYLAAGAERAFLLTVLPERNLAEALDEFLPRVGRGANLIFESNRVMGEVSADVFMLVRGSREGTDKPSFLRAVRYADAMVVRAGEDRMFEDGMNVGGRENPIFHLKQFDKISDEMRCWLLKRPGLTG
jgi:hypothetical protein